MIAGLTTNHIPKPARLGVLRKGAPKPQGGIGKDLTHFRFDPDDPNDTVLVEALQGEYGEEPNRIEVYLPFATAEENFDAWQEQWSASQLVHRCDGVHLWERNVMGELYNTRKPCPYGPEGNRQRTKQDPGCKHVGRLSVVIPALITRAGRFGLVTVLTSSIWDIVSISEALAYFETMGGTLQGIPFILSRVPRQISTPKGDGSRARREKYLISLQPTPEWASTKLEASRRLALAAPPSDRLLVSSVDDSDDEDENTIEGTSRPAPDEPQQVTNWAADFMDKARSLGFEGDDLKSTLKEAGYAKWNRGNVDAMLDVLRQAAYLQKHGEVVIVEEPELPTDDIEADYRVAEGAARAKEEVEVEEPAF